MVRNAVDHGLERPEVRERLGKPPTGIIQLRAYHSSGQVVIELEDDGQGLDDEKIVHKALAQGLISSPQGLSESDIWQLIFAPGFSTADQVTDISGRGVGLDVVRKSIEALHGRIDVRSRRGWGTIFVLSLPTPRRTPDYVILEAFATAHDHLALTKLSEALLLPPCYADDAALLIHSLNVQ